jgi:hypothetical protein
MMARSGVRFNWTPVRSVLVVTMGFPSNRSDMVMLAAAPAEAITVNTVTALIARLVNVILLMPGLSSNRKPAKRTQQERLGGSNSGTTSAMKVSDSPVRDCDTDDFMVKVH